MEKDAQGREIDVEARRPAEARLGGAPPHEPQNVPPGFAPVTSRQHSSAYVQLATCGEIGPEPSQLAPGYHLHAADQVQGIQQGPHRHDIMDIDGLIEKITEVVDGSETWRRLIEAKRVGLGENQIAPGNHVHLDLHGFRHAAGGPDSFSLEGMPGKTAEAQRPLPHAETHRAGRADAINVDGLSGTLKQPQPPSVHAASHIGGGSDPVDVSDCKGLLKDPQRPLPHALTHASTGPDKLNVGGLKGRLSDPQPPGPHSAQHAASGNDAVVVDGLKGVLADPQRPERHSGTHTAGATDVLNVEGLKGHLGTPQVPEKHALAHGAGGADMVDVGGLRGILAQPQTPMPHAGMHGAKGNDKLHVDGLPGILGEPQPPQKHAKAHSTGESDQLSLQGLPGHPAELTAHAKQNGGVHGVTRFEDRARQGQPKGYPALDEHSRVAELPAEISGDPKAFAAPQCDDRGSLDKFIWATPEKVDEMIAKQLDARVPLKEDNAIWTTRDGRTFIIKSGSPGDKLTIDPTGEPRWLAPDDEDPRTARPWLGKLYAAYGDCDPIKMHDRMGSRNVANGPSPARLGATARCVLFRPPYPMKLVEIRMFACAKTTNPYSIAIYEDLPGTIPLVHCVFDTVDGEVSIPIVKVLDGDVTLDANVDYWFCLKGLTGETREILRSLVAPTVWPSDHGMGLPVIAEMPADHTDAWGYLEGLTKPTRAMTQNGGVVPLAFLKGAE